MKPMQKNPDLELVAPARLSELDGLRSKEAAAKVACEALRAEVSELECRLAEPLASDTRETLKQVRHKLSDLQADFAIAKRDYEGAVAACAVAEIDFLLTEDRRRRRELQARLDEATQKVPAIYKRLAEEMVAVIAEVCRLEGEIHAYNKERPPGVEYLPTFEQVVRWTPKSAERFAIRPAPISSVFEIPALRFGDQDYRVPGTYAPVGIWFDVNGVPRQ